MEEGAHVSFAGFKDSRFNIKNKNLTIKKVFGHHLLLDLYKCNGSSVKSLDMCYRYLDKITDLMDVQKQAQPFVVCKEGIGINGWVPIVESGVSIYTNIDNDFVSVDIYSCKEFDFDKVKAFTKEIFGPENIHERYIFRGKDYICPVL